MLGFIAIVIGGVLGAAWADDAFGAVVGALAGWLLLRSWQHQRQIVALQQALARLQVGAAVEVVPVLVPPADLRPGER